LNLPVMIASTPDDLRAANKIILPGVGAFDWAMKRLNDSGLRNALDELVLEKRIPVLGICVGMQMMAKSSEEGVLPGLAWLDAHIKRFDTTHLPQKTHLPHMGWNDVMPAVESPLFAGLSDPRFYFLHSYYFAPEQAGQTLATTHYGIDFTSAAADRHIFGVQFHPEKSHGWGIQLLNNFARL
ncbi:imidazole glycerol phosphate synthase subunit HisH, partial [Candidatus Kaiserbacteria bacterium]|nr:imidazole glycerol phosphate synthase subunit HisH [Candidatus Kaiserbacteria bacterium]